MAVTIGTTGAVFGLTAESGVLAQSVAISTETEKASIRDNNGNETVVAFFNPKQMFSIKAKTLGTTGIAAAQPGVALTIANSIANGAVSSSNSIYVDKLDITKSATEFQEISVSATRYSVIT